MIGFTSLTFKRISTIQSICSFSRITLGLAWNYSVFYYELKNNSAQVHVIEKEKLDGARDEIDNMDKIQVANLDFNLEVPDSNLEVFLPSFLSNFDQILIKVDIRNINLEVQVSNLDFVHIVDLIPGAIEFFLLYHMDLC